MTLSPVAAAGLPQVLAMTSILPEGGPTMAHAVDAQAVAATNNFQVTVLDAAAGQSPRSLLAKVECDDLQPGLARDAQGIELNFSVKVGDEWRNLGNAVSDHFAFARLTLPPDLQFPPGDYEILVRGAKAGDKVRPARGRLLITGNKPTLLVSVDGVLLKSRPGIPAFFRRNLLQEEYPVVAGAAEALRRLAEHYDIVYVAPLRDESTLAVTRQNLFETGRLPQGPILTNDFGWRLKEHSRTVSYERLREFMDNTIAELRGFEGAPVVAGIGRDEPGRIDETLMGRHCLETRIIPQSTPRWWQMWGHNPWWRRSLARRAEAAWQATADHYIAEKDRLRDVAQGLYARRFHADPFIRQQTEIDLVSGSALCFGNSAKVYINGPEAFEAVTQLMRGAETLFGEIYEWGPDKVGSTFADILGDLAEAGKVARMTADFFGSTGWSPRAIAFFGKMVARGVHISRFIFPLAEPLALLDAPFFRTHRKVQAIKVRDAAGGVRDIAVLGGRNWKELFWTTQHDYTIVVEGPVVRSVVEHLTYVVDKLTGSPLTKRERAAFATEAPRPHADNLPLRYVVHYPKDDLKIQRTFLSLLQGDASQEFMMESPFPIMTELFRKLIDEKKRHPNKKITWVVGHHREKHLNILDAFALVQGLLLKRAGIDVVVRGPMNEHLMSPMHAKKFSDGRHVAICSWNPDEQANKDLETCVLMSPDPANTKSTETIQAVLNDGIRKDMAEGMDIEEWFRRKWEQEGWLQRKILGAFLWFARRTHRSLNYFL